MKTYTAEQMIAIRTFAYIQFNTGTYLIHVIDDERFLDVISPWVDGTGRFELDDSEAIAYWGEAIFEDFCDKALDYLGDDTVQKG